MKITTLDKASSREVSDRIILALAPLAKELGLHFEVGGGNFTPTTLTVKLQASVVEAGVVQNPLRTDYLKFGSIYKLQPEWLGKTILVNGKPFTIAGLDMAKKFNRLALLSPTGRAFRAEPHVAVRELGR